MNEYTTTAGWKQRMEKRRMKKMIPPGNLLTYITYLTRGSSSWLINYGWLAEEMNLFDSKRTYLVVLSSLGWASCFVDESDDVYAVWC